MFKMPEKHRKDNPFIPFCANNLTAGYFVIPHPKVNNYYFNCAAIAGDGWEHVSVIVKGKGKQVNRCPTWGEMCFIKNLFWDEEDAAMQLHPPKSDWVSNHEFCLHLWNPTFCAIPLPPSTMVGIKDKEATDTVLKYIQNMAANFNGYPK